MSNPSIYNGTWTMIEKDADNMDKYLQKLGVGMIKRKIAKNLTRTVTFECTDGVTMKINNKTSIADRSVEVKLGVAVTGESEDGRADVTSTILFEDGHLVIRKVDKKGLKEENVWLFEGDNLTHNLECDGAKVKLVYKRA